MITLVTGATGFIGAQLVRELVARGEPVRVTVRATSSRRNLAGLDIEYVEADLTDPHAVQRALVGVRRVYHLAGFTGSTRADRSRIAGANIATTVALLEALPFSQVERVCYLASIFTLAGGTPAIVTEESPDNLAPFRHLPYVHAKWIAQRHAEAAAARGAPLVFAYPVFCLGPGDIYNSSSDLLLRVLHRQLPALADGGLTLIDVRDAARGLIAAMERGQLRRRYLLAGERISNQALVARIAALGGVPAPALALPGGLLRAAGAFLEALLPAPPIDRTTAAIFTHHWYYAGTRAERELGFRPAYDLDTTLRDAAAWFAREGRLPPAVAARVLHLAGV